MIEGKLVRLRALEMNDLERCHRWINDGEVTRWLAARYPISLVAEKEWLEGAVRRPPGTGITLAIETLVDSRHIGNISFDSRDLTNRSAELGIVIGEKDCWSHGFGTDAIITLLQWGFAELNLHRVALKVLESNQRAIACYRKCGFVEEGQLRDEWYRFGRYHDLVIMAVLESEFQALYPSSPLA